MNDNGLSLLPNGLPPDLSRGHPLLFQFLGGLWFKAFGTSLFIGHLLPLIISLLTLIVTFKISSLIGGKKIGILTVIILVIQPIYFTQSPLILPEMMVALFSITTIYFFIKDKLYISLLFCTLTILTKETSIVIPLSIFLYIVLSNKSVKPAIPYLLPVTILVSFFIIQKFQNNWFFFPFHVDIIAAKGIEFFHNILKSIYFIFIAQFRFLASLFFLWQLLLLVNKKLGEKEKIITVLSLIIITTSIVLISGLHLMNRYYLMIFPLLILTSTLGLKNVLSINKRVVILIPFFLASLFRIQPQSNYNMGMDLGYKNCISATQKLHNFIINNDFAMKNGFCHFSIIRTFSDSRLGYIDHSTKFNLVNNLDAEVDYAIEINPNGWNRDLSHWNQFKLVKRIKEGNFEILIFEK